MKIVKLLLSCLIFIAVSFVNAEPTTVSGMLTKKGKNFIITDDAGEALKFKLPKKQADLAPKVEGLVDQNVTMVAEITESEKDGKVKKKVKSIVSIDGGSSGSDDSGSSEGCSAGSVSGTIIEKGNKKKSFYIENDDASIKLVLSKDQADLIERAKSLLDAPATVNGTIVEKNGKKGPVKTLIDITSITAG